MLIFSVIVNNKLTAQIRPLTVNDLSAVKQIRDTCVEYLHDYNIYDVEQTLQWFKMTTSRYLGITLNSDVIGYIRMQVTSTDSCYIGLDLSISYRGHGIARSVYTALFTQLRLIGIKHIKLRVLTTNTRAIRLYAFLGFTSCIGSETYVTRADGSKILDIEMERNL